jgi:hypothetical protein
MTGTDLLNGVIDTVVSQLSEGGQGIMCVKEERKKKKDDGRRTSS